MTVFFGLLYAIACATTAAGAVIALAGIFDGDGNTLQFGFFVTLGSLITVYVTGRYLQKQGLVDKIGR
jgi:branched-subunit amino acid permease